MSTPTATKIATNVAPKAIMSSASKDNLKRVPQHPSDPDNVERYKFCETVTYIVHYSFDLLLNSYAQSLLRALNYFKPRESIWLKRKK